MTTKTVANTQGIRDNYGRGKVADFLSEKISDNSVLSVVSAYFTIYAYEALADRLDRVDTLRFLFGDPTAHQAQDLLDALKSWQVTGSLKQTDWDAAIHRLELLKNVVMNPYSHPSSPNIPKQEVVDAIVAVTAFLDLVAKK